MTGDAPRPGYWLCRLVKGGTQVACAIELRACEHEPGDPSNVMDRSPTLVGFVDGDETHPSNVPWPFGTAITAEEYRYRLASAEWARKHAPDDPAANPRERVDMLRTPLPF
jgi:hypothetical protein